MCWSWRSIWIRHCQWRRARLYCCQVWHSAADCWRYSMNTRCWRRWFLNISILCCRSDSLVPRNGWKLLNIGRIDVMIYWGWRRFDAWNIVVAPLRRSLKLNWRRRRWEMWSIKCRWQFWQRVMRIWCGRWNLRFLSVFECWSALASVFIWCDERFWWVLGGSAIGGSKGHKAVLEKNWWQEKLSCRWKIVLKKD